MFGALPVRVLTNNIKEDEDCLGSVWYTATRFMARFMVIYVDINI